MSPSDLAEPVLVALMLLVAGLLVGCWNAWYWISLEQRAIRDAQPALSFSSFHICCRPPSERKRPMTALRPVA